MLEDQRILGPLTVQVPAGEEAKAVRLDATDGRWPRAVSLGLRAPGEVAADWIGEETAVALHDPWETAAVVSGRWREGPEGGARLRLDVPEVWPGRYIMLLPREGARLAVEIPAEGEVAELAWPAHATRRVLLRDGAGDALSLLPLRWSLQGEGHFDWPDGFLERIRGERSLRTDEVGAVWLECPPGRLLLTAAAPRLAPWRRLIRLPAPEAEPLPPQVMVVRPGADLTVRLRRDGEPFRRPVHLLVRDLAGEEHVQVVRDGVARFRRLPAAAAFIEAYVVGDLFLSRERRVDLEAGSETKVDLNFD